MAAAVMDEYMDGDAAMDNDEVFPCKGCGEILEEGKAFELAGNRWHLDCFRCNTCGTLLDSDANLLLLGDGSLICNNCTYSCTACGNKIEDLAILTGEQAFCATCFRCRNCKRKIENLRYARTSQGIFCMSCHESLMARRKKKSRATQERAKSREKETPPMSTQKSLPALPPSAIPPGAFASEHTDHESETPTELSPRPRQTYSQNGSSRSTSKPSRSPERPAAESPQNESLGVPSNNYRNNRNSRKFMPPSSDGNSRDSEAFFIPVALDPSPVISPDPKSTSDTKHSDRDYFGSAKPSPDSRVESQASTPHIAFQEKARQPEQDSSKIRHPTRTSSKSNRTGTSGAARKPPVSPDDRPPRTSSKASPLNDDFKLQDAPRSKKPQPSRTSSLSSSGQDSAPSANAAKAPNPRSDSLQVQTDGSGDRRPSQDRKRSGEAIRERSDSLRHDVASPQSQKPVVRKEVPSHTSRNAASKHKPAPSADDTSKANATHSSRDTYMAPRQAPAPPAQTVQASKPAKDSDEATSPKLRWSAGGEFSMDEDMARILGTDEGSSSILRRVSNAVRHGRNSETEFSQFQGRGGHTRSASETTRATASSPRWPRSPTGEETPNGRHSRDISNPMSLVTPSEDPAFLKRQLRTSEQRVAELERQFNTDKDLVHLNRKLTEKRKTVSVLDTQTEIMIQQLEVLAGYVERAKEAKKPVDPRELEDSAIKEFVQKLDRVKQSMSAAIEQLHQERDQLVEEKDQAMADRDKALLEFEQLSSKNAQLADMNNEMTHQIQERFRSQIGNDPKGSNGLGIYPQRGSSVSAIPSDAVSINTATTVVPNEGEEPIVEAGPTVVNIRKGQVKKFNWKKGSKSLAQNVTKGVNRAVGAFQERERMQAHGHISGESIGLPYNMTVAPVEQMPSPLPSNNQQGSQTPASAKQAERQGFGFFGKRANTLQKNPSTGNLAIAVPDASTQLFGSELSERADFERRQIPTVVTRCIEEVELRGMDVEGIYRKTGGTSQVKLLQEGFEKAEDHDISDPDIDITAVTSVLKQYFRKLPTPLLTFDVYDRVLESNAIANETERGAHLRKTFATMPQRHQDCLEFLMFHLTRVAQREPENLMSPKNLAVVFAPTIMRDHSLEREMTDMHSKNLAVQFIIENAESIFID